MHAADDPINKHLAVPIPNTLWHYTSFDAFQKIVESKSIWATEVRFLNDRTEFKHAREIADRIVNTTPEFDAIGSQLRGFLGDVVKFSFEAGPISQKEMQVFVASFSASQDQLSQWRGYSGGSVGVALGLNLAALRPPAEADTLVNFAPCVYKDDEKELLIRHAFRHAIHVAESSGKYAEESGKPVGENPTFREAVKGAILRTQVDLARVAALLKSNTFHEESEWRLVLPVSAKKKTLKNPPRFRSARTTLIPYIAYPLVENQNEEIPLVDLILGPGSDADSIYATELFLKAHGFSFSPSLSTVPFRPS